MSYGLVLAFFIGMIIGIVLGVIIVGFLCTSSNYDELVDAYNDGFIDGKKAVSKNKNKMNNVSDDGHNDIRC